MSRTGCDPASLTAMAVPPLQPGRRRPAATTSAAEPQPQWWRWPRPRSCCGCLRFAVCGCQAFGVRGHRCEIDGDGCRITGGLTPCGGGCHGRFASLGPKRPFGQRRPPRHLPPWKLQPTLALAYLLLSHNGGYLFAAAATPLDAEAVLEICGERRSSPPPPDWGLALSTAAAGSNRGND